MPDIQDKRRKHPSERGPASTRGERTRECTYLHQDEALALQRAADDERCSKAEILRRALRLYLEELGYPRLSGPPDQ